jgi:hypothetical protein
MSCVLEADECVKAFRISRWSFVKKIMFNCSVPLCILPFINLYASIHNSLPDSSAQHDKYRRRFNFQVLNICSSSRVHVVVDGSRLILCICFNEN